MKLKLVFLVAAIIFSACAMQEVESQPRSDNSKVQMPESKLKPSVLVELFTSEG